MTVGLSNNGYSIYQPFIASSFTLPMISIVPGFLADRCGGSYMPTVYIFLAEAVICSAVLYITYRSVKAQNS